MNEFEKQVAQISGGGLYSLQIDTLQVNLGAYCNQECSHCHIAASPRRREMMSWAVMQLILDIIGDMGCRLVDLTGGAPELNPHFCRFVADLRKAGYAVQVRTNLTALLEPGLEEMPKFLEEHQVQLVASLPCYLEANVDAQRGNGVYAKSITALKRLNALGYGSAPGLTLNLVYNPGGPVLPLEQAGLEGDYRRELAGRFGIAFSHLLTIANMPIGRFQGLLSGKNEEEKYLQLLRRSLNLQTVNKLMCRHQLSVGWDGSLYDCDFNLALGYTVNHGAPNHIRRFDPAALAKRRIVTGEHCFGCTAGYGSSCAGALT